jgi:TfoX/Sxy family transcriptional regulator of competence genes
MRKLFETAGRVKARGQFVGKRLIVYRAVGARRVDGLFVEAHRFNIVALNACNLGAYQRGASFEILRAILRPDPE